MPVYGRASVLVTPSFSGFQRATAKEMDRQAPGIGSRLASGIGTGLKRGVQVAGLAAGGVMSLAITKGFSRLSAIEQAEAKLRGLGHTADGITAIMTNALASVRGTAFGMDEAATVAATAVAAGIKPGKELEKYLKLTADAATIAGTSLGEMGSILNQVTTAGKAQTEDMNRLAERGIPIYQWLAKEYGVTATELRAMVTEGKVDAETFRKVVEDNIGGAALASGATTEGAFKNMNAALGRVGANLLTGVFPQFQRLFTGITQALSPVEGQAKVVGVALGDRIGQGVDYLIARTPAIAAFLTRTVTGLKALGDLLIRGDYTGAMADAFGWEEDSDAVAFLFSVRNGVISLIESLRSQEVGSFGTSLSSMRESFVALLPTVTTMVDQLPGLEPIFARVAEGMKFAADNAHILAGVMPILVGAFALYKTAQAANTIIGRDSAAGFVLQTTATFTQAAANFTLAKSQRMVTASAATTTAAETGVTAARTRMTAATIATTVAQKAMSAAQKVGAIAQWALNAAMSANPIGIVILLIAALVAGLIWFFTQTEVGQEIFAVAMAAIGAAATWLWENAIKPAFDFIAGALMSAGAIISELWHTYAVPAFTAIGKFFQTMALGMQVIWRTVLSPIFQLIGAIIRFLWEKVARPIFGFLAAAFVTAARTIFTIYKTVFLVAFNAIAAVITWVWEKVARPYFSFLAAAFVAVATKVRDVWQQYISPALTAFGAAVTALYNDHIKPRLELARAAFALLATKLGEVWRDNIKPVLDFLGTAVAALPGIFDAAVRKVGEYWAGLQNLAKQPIKFIVETVLNRGLIAGFNVLAGLFQTDKIADIQLPAGFARGGVLHGRSSWRDGDDQLVPMRRGEGVLVSELLRDPFERARLFHMNSAALRGQSLERARAQLGAGFASGGIYAPVPGAGRQHRSGYPWATWAGDYPVPMGTPIKAWKDGIVALVREMTTSYGKHVRINHDPGQSLYAHMSRIAVQAGQAVNAGQTVGYVGSTGNSTGPHLHFETMGAAYAAGQQSAGAGPLANLLGTFASVKDWLTDRFSGPLDRLAEIGNSPYGRAIAAAPRRIAQMIAARAEDILPFDSGGYLPTGFSTVYNGTGRPEPVLTRDQFDQMMGGGDPMDYRRFEKAVVRGTREGMRHVDIGGGLDLTSIGN